MMFKWDGDDLINESEDSHGVKETVRRVVLPDGSVQAVSSSNKARNGILLFVLK